MNHTQLHAVATSIRSLTIDAIEKSKSGHPGLPMGMADLGALLFGEVLNHNPKHPEWINRDRFVLSAGHGSMLLYSLLHLSGYDIDIDDIKSFRALNSKTPGHPEYGHTAGVEVTTGPLGQGFANAVGFSLSERFLSSQLNTSEHPIIDHYSYVLAGDGCLMEGISSEAASFAGHQQLNKLIVFYDSNRITIEGSTDLAFSEDVAQRFKAYNWQIIRCSAHDYSKMQLAIKEAKNNKEQPSLIILDSTIGKGSPNKEGTAGIHGAPLGPEETALAKQTLGIPADSEFYIAPEAISYFMDRTAQLTESFSGWNSMYASWREAYPEKAAFLDELKKSVSASVPNIAWPEYTAGQSVSTRVASGAAINRIAAKIPGFIGGSADLAPSNNTMMNECGEMSPKTPQGRNIHFGVREHAMAAISNGIAAYGLLHPFCATFLVFSDYMRPSIRLSSLMKLPVIYVLTHDSIFVGEDGPTHQPIEHVTALRTIPDLLVLRPGDAEECNLCWMIALESSNRPSTLCLTRQNLEVYPKPDDWMIHAKRGAYIVKNSSHSPDICLIATGSEVNLALEAAAEYEKTHPGTSVNVISMVSRELYSQQDQEWKQMILPESCRNIVVEAGISMGWEIFTKNPEDLFTLNQFGLSCPGTEVADFFNFNVDNLVNKMRS